MPILDWLNKDAAIKARNSVPYRLLQPVKKLSYGDPESENMLLKGVTHERMYSTGNHNLIFLFKKSKTNANAWHY